MALRRRYNEVDVVVAATYCRGTSGREINALLLVSRRRFHARRVTDFMKNTYTLAAREAQKILAQLEQRYKLNLT